MDAGGYGILQREQINLVHYLRRFKHQTLLLRDFSKLYFAFLLLQIAVAYREDTGPLHLISQPLLMTSLLLYLVSRTGSVGNNQRWLIVAVVFALIGDIVLMWNELIWQQVSHSLMFLTYSIFFWFYILRKSKLPLTLALVFAAIAAILFSSLELNFHWSAMLLLISAAFSLGLGLKLLKPEKILIPAGILLLGISSFLQIEFYSNKELVLEIAELVTYATGHFLILAGILKLVDESERVSVQKAR